MMQKQLGEILGKAFDVHMEQYETEAKTLKFDYFCSIQEEISGCPCQKRCWSLSSTRLVMSVKIDAVVRFTPDWLIESKKNICSA